MITYIYDGSFDGLLTVIYDSYYEKQPPNKIVVEEAVEEINFLTTNINVVTDNEKSKKVYAAIKEKISYQSLNNIYHAFLSEQPGCEMMIYNYIRLGFKIGNKIDEYLSKDSVLSLNDLSRKVKKEKHAMLGLIRFMELDKGLLYAKIEPKYNVIGLVSPHFAKRLVNENWIIHDEKRDLASVFSAGEWYVTQLQLQNQIELGEKEKLFQSLWQSYFKSISIEERKNLKLQQQHMPKRYWKNLIEKKLE